MSAIRHPRPAKFSLRGVALAGSLAAALGVTLAGFNEPVRAANPAAARTDAAVTSGPAVVRRLTPAQYRATIADVFGPDIPIVGRFERGLRHHGLLAIGTSQAGLSAFSLEQYYESAKGIAAEVMKPENRSKYLSCAPASPQAFDARCAEQVVGHYGRMLYRRPLTGAEKSQLLKTARTAHGQLGGFYPGLQATLAGMLIAPDFLLRIEHPVPDKLRPGQFKLDAYSAATRLSYLLINSTPDAELLRAAGAGELDTDAGLARQADRLIDSPKFERAVREVFSDMLRLDTIGELSKDPDIFPAFNSNVLSDAPEQTLRTIVDHVITKRGDYRDIFTTRTTFLTRNLGAIYRLPVTPRSGWEKLELPDPIGRAGILSHAAFLASQAHSGSSSATLRGKFIRETFLCQMVPDPPPNVSTALFDRPDAILKTARLRLAEHNENPVCAGCHKLTDPLGLSLENFDGVGTFRARENDNVIDASGSLDGKAFLGPVQLGQALRDNPQTSECFVQTMYQSAIGHEITGQSEQLLQSLLEGFKEQGYRVPALMRAIAVDREFYAVSAPSSVGPPSRTNTATRSTKGDKS